MARSIWAARIVILAAFLDLFLLLPVVPTYARSLGASPALVGLIVGAFSAANAPGNLVAGLLIDRFGRRWPVLLGLLASAALVLAYPLARTAEGLLAVRLGHGLATAVLTPGAFALIGDAAASDRRGRVMGVSGAIIAAAALIGPPLGGLLRDRLGVGAVFVVDALLLLAAAGAYGLLTSNLRPRDRLVAPAGRLAWRQPRLIAAYLAALGLTVGLGTLITHLPLLLEARGEPAARIGLAFTVYAAVALLMLAGPPNRLSDGSDRLGPLGFGLALVGLGLLLLTTDGGVASVVAGMALFGLGFGLLFPAATALVAEVAGRDERGRAFGLFYAVYSLGVVLGALLSGLLGQWLPGVAAAPFLAGGLIALLSAPLLRLVGRHVPAPADPAPDG